MPFNSQDFNKEKIQNLTDLVIHVKNSEPLNPIFLGYSYLLFNIINSARQGLYCYSETFFVINKNDVKNLKAVKKELELLGYNVKIKVQRTPKRLTLTISWN
jgi:hypothetical protein